MKSTILLLEPDEILGEAYKSFLVHKGYQVSWAKTSESAVQALDATPTDLIILEIQIAGHNGLEFLHEIRSYSDWKNIPVIINSFVTPSRLHANSHAELGIAKSLYKPQTTLVKLHQAVEEQLQKIAV